jgi:membrane protease YdiL (CAAX protease family)
MNLIKSKPGLSYVVIAYLITYIITIPLIWLSDSLNRVTYELWQAAGALGPTIAAVIVIWRWKGNDGLKELRQRCLKYSGVKLLLFSLMPIMVFLFVFPVENMIGSFTLLDMLEGFTVEYGGYLWLVPIASLSYGVFEEVGWRGFLQPYLQRKYDPLRTTVILTPIWWLWHLPMFFYRWELWPYSIVYMPLLMFSGTLVFTWLLNKSGGSVLMTMIIHVSYDLISSHYTGVSTIVVSIIWIVIDVWILYRYISNLRKHDHLQERVSI